MDIAAAFMAASINAFEANKRLADRAVEQVSDHKLHTALDVNTNSIAVIMKHVAGNLLSRWTDFLTTDGEKPWRNRDDEFVDTFRSREEILEYWERGWACLLKTLKSRIPCRWPWSARWATPATTSARSSRLPASMPERSGLR